MAWSKENEKLLLEKWGQISLEEIMEILNLTKDSVVRKARRMGLDVRKNRDKLQKKLWLVEENEYLRINYKVIPLKEIMTYLKRNENSILKHAQLLCITEKRGRKWSSEEEEYLEDKWGIIPIEKIAKVLNRTSEAVLIKSNLLSLREQIIANGIFLTTTNITTILGYPNRKIYNYIKQGLIKQKKFNTGKRFKYQIKIDSFLRFLESHPQLWNTTTADMHQIKSYYVNFTVYANEKIRFTNNLPAWLDQKIVEDTLSNSPVKHNSRWDNKADKSLISMAQKMYCLDDIFKKLKRTIPAIKARIYVLRRRYPNINIPMPIQSYLELVI